MCNELIDVLRIVPCSLPKLLWNVLATRLFLKCRMAAIKRAPFITPVDAYPTIVRRVTSR